MLINCQLWLSSVTVAPRHLTLFGISISSPPPASVLLPFCATYIYVPLSFVSSFLKAFLSFVKKEKKTFSTVLFFSSFKKNPTTLYWMPDSCGHYPRERSFFTNLVFFIHLRQSHAAIEQVPKRCFVLRGAQMCFSMIHFLLKSLVVALSHAVRGKNDVNFQYNACFYNRLQRTFEITARLWLYMLMNASWYVSRRLEQPASLPGVHRL